MRSGNFGRQFLVLTLLLFCFVASSSIAHQVAAGSAAVTPSGQGVGANDPGSGHNASDVVTLVKRVLRHFHRKRDRERQPGAPASQEKFSAGESQPAGDPKIPEIPGAIVRVLKDGEKIPERKHPEYEDWSRPELMPGMKLEAVPLGTAKGDGFTRELLHVQWREMDPIDMWLIKPTGVKNPPVILYLYSYDGSNERYKNDDYCKFLIHDGFAAVGFVSALTEHRFHDRSRNQTSVSQLQEALATTTHDIQMILNYLEKRGDLNVNRVGMWADGSGAAIAIMASAVDTRIKALDLLDPWGDWPDWLAKSKLVPEDSRAEYLTPSFLSQVVDLDPLQYFPRVKAQKVRLQYIKNGFSITPRDVREKMERAAPPNAEMVHYEDTKAFVSDVAAKGIGFDWIKANLSTSNPQNQTTGQNKSALGGKSNAEPR